MLKRPDNNKTLFVLLIEIEQGDDDEGAFDRTLDDKKVGGVGSACDLVAAHGLWAG